MVSVKEIELEGHIIDSLILPRVLDTIMDMDGDFEILELRVGKRTTDTSYCRILVRGRDERHLNEILYALHKLGARIPEVEEAELKPALADGVLPDGFYTTTNHPTYVNVGGEWLEVENIEMDKVIVVYPERKRAVAKPIRKVRKGELVVVGTRGIRVIPPERPRGSMGIFEFMSSKTSPEKPTRSLIRSIAREIHKTKKEGGKIVVVAGPAVVHTGAAPALAKMIRDGYVDVLLAGNALAVHDIEYALFGTSLGMDIETGKPAPGGHRHHLWAINIVNRAGSIRKAVELGFIRSGIMYECVKNNVPFVLAGSIRDDGPLPDVITDVLEAQDRMREHLRGASLVLMLATALHSIAVGNMLPSTVKTICVDINPNTITKLLDRGTAQAVGIVTNVGEFLTLLVEELSKLKDEETSKSE